MCGIVGIAHGAVQPTDRLDRETRAMARVLSHRGPDGEGYWSDAEAGVALGHLRLAILDLSPAGRQPMLSASGRYVVSFNGEIYNYAVLRAELQRAGNAPAWRGHSDTEVMLAAFEAWGVQRTLQHLNGMFAMGVVDRARRTLTLARDPIGERPLYYADVGGALAFASELKALRTLDGFDATIDRNVLASFFYYGYVPSPHAIFKGTAKLPPGHWIEVPLAQPCGSLVPRAFWSVAQAREAAGEPPVGDAQAIDRLEELLSDSIALRMVADVPVGAFLSGGVDSSTVVALMQRLASRPVKTYSIGFEVARYDESGHARAVARHLGTEHTELVVTDQQARDTIPSLPTIYDEPFADSSQIPTYLVSALARRQVTVSLSGDGGDELFAGYPRYGLGDRLWRMTRGLTAPVRSAAGMALDAVPGPLLHGAFKLARRLFRNMPDLGSPGESLPKLGRVLRAPDVPTMYEAVIGFWPRPEHLVRGASAYARGGTWAVPAPVDPADAVLLPMQYRDLVAYLPDDILVKTDRASMAVSLESRIPLLDPRLIGFAMSLPPALKARDGESKWLLKQLLYRHVPRKLVERPKMGFGIPLGEWLRGPLRDWCDALLDPAQIALHGYLEPAPVERAWTAHRTGRADCSFRLWQVLMFQSWLDSLSAPACRAPPPPMLGTATAVTGAASAAA